MQRACRLTHSKPQEMLGPMIEQKTNENQMSEAMWKRKRAWFLGDWQVQLPEAFNFIVPSLFLLHTAREVQQQVENWIAVCTPCTPCNPPPPPLSAPPPPPPWGVGVTK